MSKEHINNNDGLSSVTAVLNTSGVRKNIILLKKCFISFFFTAKETSVENYLASSVGSLYPSCVLNIQMKPVTSIIVLVVCDVEC